MYALPHQVEFLSDAWLAETERYLQQELKAGRLAAAPETANDSRRRCPGTGGRAKLQPIGGA